ncbi:prepilin peptidase [Aestuariivirga sp.]|jgi:prepilin peptidase CpaA|uniref:prepilin peptidase n=1 Tax=Aestuariivirga sp. TaxID=2650926 RepID=UPI00378370C5
MVDPLSVFPGVNVVLFPLLMVVAGAGDALSMRIPNRLIVLVTVWFFPLAIGAGMPLQVFGMHVATGMVALLFGFLLFAGRAIGGGDAKLFAAGSLWFGYPQVFDFLVFTTLAGGVLALAVSGWSVMRWEADLRGLRQPAPFERITPNVPYGFAIAAGAILASPSGWWMTATAN